MLKLNYGEPPSHIVNLLHELDMFSTLGPWSGNALGMLSCTFMRPGKTPRLLVCCS